jgi:tetratricopeptide (TPR) repeat protein
MTSAEGMLLPRSVTSTELRQLWESGRRGLAIRRALEGWDELLRSGDDLRWLEGALRSCGLAAEAFAVQAERIRRKKAQAREWEPFIRSVLESGDPWWARELLDEAGVDCREIQALRVEAALALGDASDLISAWVKEHLDEAALEAAVGWWVRNDRIEEAARLVDETDRLTLWRARFALWRNDPGTARTLLETLSPNPEVRCLEAIATALEGNLEKAESLLRPLLESEAQAEAASWMATVLRKQRRYAEAVRAADAANIASTAFNLIARLERELASEFERAGDGPAGDSTLPRWLRLFVSSARRISPRRLRTIGELEHARMLYPLGLKPNDSIAALEKALERFAGNHTFHLSTADGGKLASYPLPLDPRQLGAIAQLVLWTRGAEATRALYRDLASLVDNHPLYRIYHGELELWMGAYEEAERIFRQILDRDKTVRWAWIGLGASLMFQGDLRQAQDIWDRGLSITHWAGPTLYVYRGECYRRQGKAALARRELETALQQKPHRLSARINLALLNEDPEAIERVEQECIAFAPLLMEELSGSPAERLEKVLEAMRGNRSSSQWHVTYHLWGHLWRRGV